MDYYRILQVAQDAEPEVIDRAYRALSLKYHPDVTQQSGRAEANRKMQQINEAYKVLGDPGRRRRYDASIPAQAGASAWDAFMDKGLLGMFLDKMMPPR